MATQAQVKSFIKIISNIAQAECNKRIKKILPSVCIAQAACESAWGTSSKMIKANAVFGIKAGSSWKGKVYSTKTKECYDSIKYTTITDLFRAYDSLEDSVADYYNLLTCNDRYCKAVNETNPQKTITAIKNGGYSTDPKYISTITNIINIYNLTIYDTCMTNERILKLGCMGYDVKQLQVALTACQYNCGVSDGIFGNKTLTALKLFQKDKKLIVDGVVGKKTKAELKI